MTKFFKKENLMKTKKILSLILAVLMIVSAIPMALIPATAEDAAVPSASESATTKQEYVGGIPFETVALYSETVSPSGGWYAYKTDLTDLNASGKNAQDAAGVLIDVSWSKEGLSKAYLKFKLDNNPSTMGADGNTYGAFYAADGSKSGYYTGAKAGWIDIPAASFTGTVFIPKAKLNNWSKADFSVFSVAMDCGQSATNLHASFSNVRMAFWQDWNDADYKTVTIYDGPTTPSVTAWNTYTTDLTELNAAFENVQDALGVLIDVSWNKENLSQAAIKLKMDDAAGSLRASGGTDGVYYAADGTVLGGTLERNWLNIPASSFNGKVFIPKASLETWSKTDFSVFRFALNCGQSASNLHASFSNVRVVFAAPSDAPYETISIYNETVSPSGGGWLTYNTDLTALNAAGKDARDAAGILIDVSWNNSSLSTAQFKFKLDAAGNGATDGSYYSKDGSITGESKTNNWFLISQKSFTGTIFLPRESLNTWNKSDFSSFVFAMNCGQSASNLCAKFTNVRLVFLPPAESAPSVLPTTEQEYQKFDINVDYVLYGDENPDAFSRWQGTDMNIGSTKDAWATAEGIMFKFDTTGVDPSIREKLGFAIQFSMGSGKSYVEGDESGAPSGVANGYYFVSAGMLRVHAGGASTYNGELAKEQELTTNWYYSTNGTDWEVAVEKSNAGRRVLLTDEHTVGYVFVPFEDLWCMGPNGTGLYGYRQIGSFADGIAAMTEAGSNFNIRNFGLCLQSSTNGTVENLAIQPETQFSEFTFVYDRDCAVPMFVLRTASVTLSDDLAYNVYADIPESVADSKMIFSFEGADIEIAGVVQNDGSTKYSFPNILPQQVTSKITATWTATLSDGGKVIDSNTSSIYDYLKSMMSNQSYAEWHELAQATMNYAAAAQAREGSGFTGELISAEDVKPLENAVTDYTTLEGYDTIGLALGESSGFNGAALRLEGTIEMKISVATTITAVTYEINGRTGTLDVVDGAVYVPIKAFEMAKTLTVKDANNAEDVLTVSVNWYLANVTAGGANTKNLINAIANYGVAAAKKK